jgi:hypothetical protein
MAMCGFALYSFFLIAIRAYLGLKIKWQKNACYIFLFNFLKVLEQL